MINLHSAFQCNCSKGESPLMEKINKLLAYLTLPLAVVIVYSAFMRYVFHNMPDWSFEISLFMFGIQAIMGGAYCHARKKHVSVDILEKYLSPKGKIRLEIVSECVILFVCIILIYISVPWAWQSFMIGEKSMHQTAFNPSIWWFKTVVPVGTLLLMVQSFRNLSIKIRECRGK
ncbi:MULTISPECIES: TRAP transporter small permease [Aminobacterium]|jgi:TRAP-type mannitol/chloroaromatic compound transport system permease small subunit|nr:MULTISPECIES: TRAP transporter small permease [Aminobacterium]MDD4586077.1 TRAP transporter small permease [Aminobacterium colombiense]NLK29946.1 TRAP transporter small permease [Aminobacterium colombiense]